jgi:hypothetical protein
MPGPSEPLASRVLAEHLDVAEPARHPDECHIAFSHHRERDVGASRRRVTGHGAFEMHAGGRRRPSGPEGERSSMTALVEVAGQAPRVRRRRRPGLRSPNRFVTGATARAARLIRPACHRVVRRVPNPASTSVLGWHGERHRVAARPSRGARQAEALENRPVARPSDVPRNCFGHGRPARPAESASPGLLPPCQPERPDPAMRGTRGCGR